LSEDRLRTLRNQYRLPPNFLLFINKVEPRKNLKNVIKAFELMDTPCHLVIGGSLGWKYKDIVSAWENSSKKKFIHYLGYVPEDDKPYLIKLARLFLYPSFYEGFGLQILEGMAVGTPVITSQVTSMPEVAGDGALLVDPYHVGSMARAMDLLMTDEAVRDRFIQKGLVRAQNYSWERTAGIMLKAFKERS
jgi:glycosyltransferase involved in cell wall biosynthesis